MKYAWQISLAFLTLFLQSCFTGIEGTKQIELSRDDRRLNTATPEELLLGDIQGTPLGKWQTGRRFQVTDSRILYALSPGTRIFNRGLVPGEILRYKGMGIQHMPDGTENTVLEFMTEDEAEVWLPSGKKTSEAPADVMSDRLPMLIDLEMVRKADSILRGRQLWTKSALQYDGGGERITASRYVGIKVDSVTPGTGDFPLRIWFDADTVPSSVPRYIKIDFNYGQTDSRQFSKIFSLSDPKLRYPAISDANWQKICDGRVAVGMTKEECRLALGNPSDAATGRDYSNTYDLWQYPDGRFLRFVDGLLHDYR